MKRIRVLYCVLYALCLPLALCTFLLVFPPAVAAAPAAPLPGDSLYRTPLALQDQDARRFDLASMRGKPVIVSMFYASCTSACPLTIDTIDQIRRAADGTGRAAPSVLMISFDPQHDDVLNLAAMAKAHQLDPAYWRLTRPTAGDVMAFAATLGVAYRQRADGDFSHNAVIALLDENGRLVAQTSLVGEVDPAFLAAVKARVANH
jgi:protein SCO1